MSTVSFREKARTLFEFSLYECISGGLGIMMFFAATWYLSSGIDAIIALGILGLYAVVLAVILAGVHLITKKKSPLLQLIIRTYLRMGSALLIVGLCVWAFCYYQNEVEPAKLWVYTLSNGKKTVEFHSMSHIGSDRFYTETKEWVKSKKAQGYTLYFEGVRAGSDENEKKFEKLLGFMPTQELYQQFSKLYGLRQQDNHEFLWFTGAKDKNVDVSIDDIIHLYEAKNGTALTSSGLSGTGETLVQSGGVVSSSGIPLSASGNTLSGALQTASGKTLTGTENNTTQKPAPSERIASGATASGALADTGTKSMNEQIEADIAEIIQSIPPKQLECIRYFNRAVLNFLVKHKAFWLQDLSTVAAPGLFDVILQERNKHLVDEIVASDDQKIIILYGDLHFDGVFDILQNRDSKWKLAEPILWNTPMNP